MKTEKDLSSLFDTLRNDQPYILFNEVKTEFQLKADSGIRKVRLKKNQLFTLKNFMLMFSLSLITFLSIFIISNNTEESLDKNETTNKEENGIIFSKTNLSDTNQRELHFPDNKKVIYQNQKVDDVSYLQPQIVSDSSYYVNKPSEKVNIGYFNKEKYVYPILTEKEKEENEKNKRIMLKQLEKTDKKCYSNIPAGKLKSGDSIVQISSFFMSKTEVTNLEYRTFLFDLLIHERKEEFLNAIPKQSLWTEMFGESNRVMEDLYFTHEAYNEYPVVNVSRQGAEMYCEWLRQEFLISAKLKDKNKIAAVRLPFRDEWTYAASSGGKNNVYPWQTAKTTNESGCYLANYKPFKDNYHADGGFYTVHVKSYLPNEFGLFNISGNVAEMVYNSRDKRDFGTAGGGWLSDEEELRINGKDNYSNQSNPHPNVGFRIVFTLKD